MLDHASWRELHAPHARRDSVHRAQPCELANQLATHGRDAELPFLRDVAVAERVAGEVGLEIFARQIPQHLWHVLAMAAGAALAREEAPQRRGIEDDPGAVVLRR